MKQLSMALLTALFVIACGSKSKPATTTNTETSTGSDTPAAGSAAGAQEGEMCGDGMMGTPNMPCAEGLVCEASGAPPPPEGAAASGATGICKKPQ